MIIIIHYNNFYDIDINNHCEYDY